jgi:D-alanine transaminase
MGNDEGTSSNAYIVKDGKVITRGLSNRSGGVHAPCAVSSGEKRVLRLKSGVYVHDAYAPMRPSTSANFVMPIVRLTTRVGGGQPGPVTRRLREMFLEEAMK